MISKITFNKVKLNFNHNQISLFEDINENHIVQEIKNTSKLHSLALCIRKENASSKFTEERMSLVTETSRVNNFPYQSLHAFSTK